MYRKILIKGKYVKIDIALLAVDDKGIPYHRDSYADDMVDGMYVPDTDKIAEVEVLAHNADIQTQIEEIESVMEGRVMREYNFGTDAEKIIATEIILNCNSSIEALRGQRQ